MNINGENNQNMNMGSNEGNSHQGKTVSRLVKHDGKVIGYELSDGQVTSKEEGVQMAKDGEIDGVIVSKRKDSEYLKSKPDQSEDNNLSTLASISVKDETIK